MTWNYRVVHRRCGDTDTFTIHEVFYNGAGEITAMTEDPVEPMGESLQELKDDVELMLTALNHPVVVEGEVKYAPMEEDDGQEAKDPSQAVGH